ncbi:putative quinol monooxygenase [Pseudoteredinibacter isoporae]|uniref:Quinol monooxygenase YgiN n=1 Tax=Pseudoteredinibacter isoporae TaxID=570281 RepID=A0A7X0MXV8_9GAMM|nr:putative quinol monooxygenase [Pseudoteredinibacter isoporae]MBB6523620.1 quinol monooxygenase YgiN [Pseudoteredinibacter isoporae]NHO89127.1 antibiotic biosynthesis monooxygenase [Pseudoteredinibacter isoporae]NIB22262.1 antibiotic biosynthesis monooxygenase [Pseudoteredinibacter isoporae]
MSEVNLLVRVSAKEEHIEELKAEMRKAQALTHQEAGCIRYQFYQDRKVPHMFYVQECYKDKTAFLAHANSDHMAAYLATTEGMIQSVDMHKVDPV